MTQHFLLSSKARTISSREVAQLSDEEAFDLLCELRWGSKEVVVCPKCGSIRHIGLARVNNGGANIAIIHSA